MMFSNSEALQSLKALHKCASVTLTLEHSATTSYPEGCESFFNSRIVRIGFPKSFDTVIFWRAVPSLVSATFHIDESSFFDGPHLELLFVSVFTSFASYL